ncbi:MAG: iron ABC transporter permease [Methanoregula sp.]|jgi:iron complex transport system permease protein|nr:iron ABC transporter permease [Methanoregula sp.]MDD5023851.1 iron ABC transporter permease [Methanoregula sp.]MDD5186861.1 iron ABC transporter permease [Methanoregula sp.]
MAENIEILYHREWHHRWLVLLALACTLLIVGFIALNAGSIHLTVADVISSLFSPAAVSPQTQMVVMDLRMPRILLAILTGASLAVAGTVMQALMRNPLVSPFTLGMSSAASFGAACAIVMSSLPLLSLLFMKYQDGFIVISAFVFGLGSIFIIYAISLRRGSTSATLILAGVVIGYIFQAGLMILQYTSNNEKLRQITLWLMGGMWGANWSAIFIITPIVILCLAYLLYKAWDFNALLAGDEVATNAGVEIKKVRLWGLFFCTLASSACLAFTGIIGFIGLIGPHIGRLIIGQDNRYLIPCSALLGAVILLVSDTIGRTIIEPVEIPVGVIMYLLGGLFFLYLILSKNNRIFT